MKTSPKEPRSAARIGRSFRPASFTFYIPTNPISRKVDHFPGEAIGLEGPCAILLENGPFFSVLLARRIDYSQVRSRLELNLAFQFKLLPTNEALFRGFARVEIFRHTSGIWIATDPESGRLFSSPSNDPYRVIFLTPELYELLRGDTKKHYPDRIWDYCRELFGRLPGFYSPDKDTLMAPDDYAAAQARFPGEKFL